MVDEDKTSDYKLTLPFSEEIIGVKLSEYFEEVYE